MLPFIGPPYEQLRADIDILQGNVLTRLSCSEIFNDHRFAHCFTSTCADERLLKISQYLTQLAGSL